MSGVGGRGGRELAAGVPETRPSARRNRYIRRWIGTIEGLRNRAGPALVGGTLLILIAGQVAFPLEAGARETHIGWMEALYNTLGLFAFAGNRFGFPHTAVLRAVYFAAPFVSASALIETALRVVASGSTFLLFGMRGHTVVGGIGNLGTLIASRQDDLGEMQVLIDRDPRDRAGKEVGGPSLGPHVVIVGDMTVASVLRRARVQHANKVFLTAADDLVNIEAAARIRALIPAGTAGPTVYCHVYDEELREGLADEHPGLVYFNSYRLSAKALVARLFRDGWLPSVEVSRSCNLVARGAGFALAREAPPSPVFIVVGLGRFGRSVLQQLVDAAPANARFVAVDRSARAVDSAIGSLAPHERPAVTGLAADALDGGWLDAMPKDGRAAVVLFCTDNDRANLTMAMRAARAGHRTMSRMFDQEAGAALHEAYANHQEIGVAGFRELFHGAFPILTHTQAPSQHGPSAQRIRTCVGQKGTKELWYLMRLSPDEVASVSAKHGSVRLSDLAWDGPAGEAPPADAWLLTTKDLAGLPTRA